MYVAIILVLEFLYLTCQLAVVAGILSVLEVAEIDILGKDAPILSLQGKGHRARSVRDAAAIYRIDGHVLAERDLGSCGEHLEWLLTPDGDLTVSGS